MQVIPVLDLKSGLVVLAAGGQRDTYRPIDTPLCPDPAPPSVVRAFLGIFSFGIFYVADLDAIEGSARNTDSIVTLARTHPTIEFWLDAGFADPADVAPYVAVDNMRFVVGSESLRSIESYTAIRSDPRFDGHILSLDRKNGLELGPTELIHQSDLWPDTVISMDLTQVGQSAGPNLERIRALRAIRPGINVVAAGGVRDLTDLVDLAANGVGFALVATALHNQKLGRQQLERLDNA